MKTIRLEAAPDLVERLAFEGQPLKAVIELIWNGLDADAHVVEVEIEPNALGGIAAVKVTDDGHGMGPEACAADFGRVGGSWKRPARRSRGEGRPLHGQSGQGRLRAFALGSTVTWTTVGEDPIGARLETVVTASDANRSDFDLSDPTPTTAPLGTRFVARDKQSTKLNLLVADDAPAVVSAALAPYLIAHPGVEVRYDGVVLTPAANVHLDVVQDLVFHHDDVAEAAKLRIIEWQSGSERKIYLCDGEGVPVDEIPSKTAPDFSYSAYVMWEPMQAHRNEWLLGDSDATAVGALLHASRTAIEDYFEQRRAEQRREAVDEWIERDTYPYRGEPAGPTDEVERATFDVVATAIRRHIPSEPRKQRLTLGLLQNSLRHSPGDLSRILDEFLGLPRAEVQQLEHLLERTSLSRLIRASTSVTGRLDFLAALELLVFDPDASNLTKEREHLHRMLERELWVFGEQYNMMISERSLTAVLDRHLHILGREATTSGTVRRLDGTTGRVDLMLSAAANEHDRNRHLVVELKAPDVVATERELRQIKSYAKAVVGDPRFANSSTIWDFWLVTATLDDDVKQEANQRDRARGLVFEPDLPELPDTKVRVWARTWDTIIDDGRRRLSYFKDALDHDPSVRDVLDYLGREHADVLPPGLLDRHVTG